MTKTDQKIRIFVLEFLIDGNGTRAAGVAGWSKKTASAAASRLLRNVKVQKLLKEAQEKVQERSLVTLEEIVTDLKTVKSRCLQQVPVMVRQGRGMVQKTDPDTGEGVWEFDSSGANRSLELLGKTIGAYKDNVNMTVHQPEKIEFIPARRRDAPGRGK